MCMTDDNRQKLLFYEVQKFRQTWLLILLAVVGGFALFDIYKYLFLNSNIYFMGLWIVGIGIPVLFAFMKMVTTVSPTGIKVRFFPFLTKQFFYEDILSYKVKQYKALDYGGYGIKVGALNVSGNWGVELEFKNKEKVLIGSQRAQELAQAIDNAKNLKAIN